MILFVFLIFAPFLFIVIRSAIGTNEKENTIPQKVILGFYLFLIILYIATIFMAKYNYYIRGYRSTILLFISMTLMGMIYWLTDRRPAFTSFFRAVLFCFSVVTIGLSFFLLFYLADGYKKDLLYNDSTYRLENSPEVMRVARPPDLYVKSGLFERKFYPKDSPGLNRFFLEQDDVTQIKIESTADNKVVTLVYHTIKEPADLSNPLKFEYYK